MHRIPISIIGACIFFCLPGGTNSNPGLRADEKLVNEKDTDEKDTDEKSRLSKPEWSPRRRGAVRLAQATSTTEKSSPRKDEQEKASSSQPKTGSQEPPALKVEKPAARVAQENVITLQPPLSSAPTMRLDRPMVVSPSTETRLLPPEIQADAYHLGDQDMGAGPPGSCTGPFCPTCRQQLSDPRGLSMFGPIFPLRLSGGWVRPEFLYWWTEGMDVPPLVTSGAGGPVVFGADEINDDWRSGGRLHAGVWINPSLVTAIEGSLFALTDETTSFQAAGTTAAPLARPFFNLATLTGDASLVPAAAFTTGTIAIEATTQFVGAELMLRQMAGAPGRFATAILVGYRYNRLDDELRIGEFQIGAGPTTVTRFDYFSTENSFHGAQVGFMTGTRYNRLTGEFVLKLGLGNTHSKVRIDGATTTVVGVGAPVTTTGGLLAQSSNIGFYEQDEFSVIPELGATIGFNITERFRVTAGYTFIYWSRVARPHDQIDRDISLPVLPGPNAARPEFTFNKSDFWAQGVNLGLEYAF